MAVQLPVVVVMGVSGSGKSTFGRRLAQRLALPFYDGDDDHPTANIEKMARGEPLDDTDRRPWLARLRRRIEDCLTQGGAAVIACSALKAKYRQSLIGGLDDVRLIHLDGSRELLEQRLSERRSHFFRPELLDSQLATLEPPAANEALILDVRHTPGELVARVVADLYGD